MLDHLADGGQNGRHIAPLHPLAAARIEHRLQLLDDERDIAAAPKDGADHARQRHRPGIMFGVLGIDEYLEGCAPAIAQYVVDGYVDRVIALGPANLIGAAGQ